MPVLAPPQAAIDKLPKAQREVMQLTAQGLSVPEIMERTGRSRTSVDTALSRARTNLVSRGLHLGASTKRPDVGNPEVEAQRGKVVPIRNANGQLLAPNGEPSRLSERLWVTVRTPFFRRWFGDWLALLEQSRIDAFVDRALDDGSFGETLTLRKLTEEEVLAIKKLTGVDASGLRHELNANQIRHSYKRHKQDTTPIAADDLKRIPEVLDGWDYVERGSENAKRPSVRFVKRVNGDLFVVERVFVNQTGRGPRLMQITMWKEAKPRLPAVGNDSQLIYARSAGSARKNLLFVNGRVNPESVSKVVDENGEPLLVYHGTAEAFAEFDAARRGELTEAKSARRAYFFTDHERTARSYAVYAAEDGPIKRLVALANEAERRGDWAAYDKALAEAERLDTVAGRSERRESATVMSVFLRGDMMEFDAEGRTPLDLRLDGEPLSGTLAAAKRAGKDGVVFQSLNDAINLVHVPATHYAIFNKSNAKRTDNLGTFDESGIMLQASTKQPGKPSAADKLRLKSVLDEIGKLLESAPAKAQEMSVEEAVKRVLDDMEPDTIADVDAAVAGAGVKTMDDVDKIFQPPVGDKPTLGARLRGVIESFSTNFLTRFAPLKHLEYQGNRAKFDFVGNVLRGDLKSRAAVRLVRERIDLRTAELEKDWALAQAAKPLERIEPLN